MNRKLFSLLAVTTVCCFALFSLLRPALAQEEPAAPAPPVKQEMVPAKATPPAADPSKPASPKPSPDSKTEPVIREQTIYIPYEKLRKTFEKEGRGVFLPYEKFRELWDAAREATKTPDDKGPPVGALITEIENEATVAGDVIRVNAKLKIEILKPGWNEVPLRLADAAITAARVDKRPARVVADGDKGYKLLVENEGDDPWEIELDLQYAKAITRAPGQNSVSFQAPRAPVSRWRVRIPEAGVKVDLHPLIAATEVTTEDGTKPKPDAPAAPEGEKPPKKDESASGGETVILAFVGAAPEVRISWTPKAEGATGLEALASVQVQQQVFVTEGVTRTHTQLNYAISRAELGQLTIQVPADQKVVNVLDANVRQWSVETAEQGQKITVQLFEPAKKSQSVTVELEKFSDEESEKVTHTLGVPVVKALNVGRQQGVLVVQVAGGLRAEATSSSGLVQVDAGDLPKQLAAQKWAFSFRFAAAGFKLDLGIEKIQPRIVVDSLVEIDVLPERIAVELFASYTVQRAGVFQLELDIPSGYEVRHVRGRAAAGAEAVQVDTHHVEDAEGETPRRLRVNLSRKAMGRVGLSVRLEKDLNEPDLLSPTGKSAELALSLPQVVADSVERAKGRLVIYAPESLRVNPTGMEGLRSVSFEEAFEGMEPTPRAGPSNVRPVLAFAFGRESTSLSLAAERRKPQVTIAQLLTARIEDGVVKYKATLDYQILYSGVKSLRIDVPEEVSALLRNNTSAIREKVMEPQPDDVSEGCVAWTLAGENELIGSGRIELVWEKKIEKLDVGRSVELVVGRLIPMGVDRAWGQIVLAKAETIDIGSAGAPSGLRSIDPQHDLMNGVKVPDAARAYEFHDDWELKITATRYELQEIKHTSIERSVLRMVVTRADKTTVQALYRIRSAGQRLEIQMPEKSEFDVKPLIDGRPVTLEVGQDQSYFVPLVDSNSDQSFLLELRYTYESEAVVRPKWPVFPMKPAVQQVYLCVYLPEELDLVEKIGPWTIQFGWDLDSKGNFRPGRGANNEYPDDESLLEWVSQDIELPETFPTDGRVYVFTALRPGSPTDDALWLITMHRTWLNLIFCSVVLLAGALLLPMRPKWKIFGAGSLAIFLIVLGVFWPILTWHVCDAPLAAAIGVVLIVWLLKFVFRTLPRLRLAAGSPPFSGPPEPPPEKPPTAKKLPSGTDQPDAPVAAEPVDEGSDIAKPSDDNRPVFEPTDDKSTDTDSTEGGKTDA
jgi:hypothetical protein